MTKIAHKLQSPKPYDDVKCLPQLAELYKLVKMLSVYVWV